MSDAILRPATDADAGQVADVYLSSRRTFVAFAPLAHSDDDVRNWVTNVLIPAGGVSVALARGSDKNVVGMMAISRDGGIGWVDHLYLIPAVVGRGLGGQFIEHAKETLGSPIRLHTFQANTGARRFYERHGFRALEFSDGATNEERCPDILYEWTAAT